MSFMSRDAACLGSRTVLTSFLSFSSSRVQIQQINYKMSILLSSDSKSEIEGVRWILIRRSVVGLVFLAIITMSMIRYATYLAQQKKREAERRRKERERLKRDGGRTDNSAPADAAVILSAS